MRQKMPFNTRRSSTLGTPRGLLGNKGAITPPIPRPTGRILAMTAPSSRHGIRIAAPSQTVIEAYVP